MGEARRRLVCSLVLVSLAWSLFCAWISEPGWGTAPVSRSAVGAGSSVALAMPGAARDRAATAATVRRLNDFT